MPELPKVLTDIATALFTKPATVTAVSYPDKYLKKIVFTGDALKGLKCPPGAQIEPRVSDRHMRHYNPSAYDAATGTMEMLIYLHGMGPGSAWAEKIQAGDKLNIMGPAMKIHADESHARQVFLGDETTIGTFLFLQNSLAKGQTFTGAIEAEPDLLHLNQTVNLQLPNVARTSQRGRALMNWLIESYEANQDALFYLLGHNASNLLLRDWLKDKGVPNSRIAMRRYWADGMEGL